MADQNTVLIGENSREQVAYKLMGLIASAEKVYLQGPNVTSSREWILKTYMQCLMAVKQPEYPDDVLKMHKD